MMSITMLTSRWSANILCVSYGFQGIAVDSTDQRMAALEPESQSMLRLSLALLAAISFLSCARGLPSQPEAGVLYFRDSGGTLHQYKVTEADFNEHADNQSPWLTLHIAADDKIGPNDKDNQRPFLEINIPLGSSPDTQLKAGRVFTPSAYDDSLGNLTNFYHWEHTRLEPAEIKVIECSGDRCLVQVSGASDQGSVLVKASLRRNPERRRSFN